jgi:tetratricopeptide (TPR) repeat protein
LRRELVDEQPDNWDARFELARSYQNTANVFGRINSDSPLRAEAPCKGKATVDCALAALEDARELQEDLVGQKPGNTECRNDLVYTCNLQTEMLLSKGDPQAAYDPYEEAYNNSRELVRGNEGDLFLLDGLVTALVNRARWAAQRRPEELPGALKNAQGRLDDLMKARDSDPEDLYQQAVLRVLGGNADGAMESLQKSLDVGFSNIGLLERDSGLKDLRSRADFQALVKGLTEKD